MLMHGTNTLWGGWADNLSMIMYIVIPWLYNVYKMSNWSQQTFIKVYVINHSDLLNMEMVYGLGIGNKFQSYSQFL